MKRERERDLLRDYHTRSSALFGVNGHLSETDVSSLTEDGKEHLLAARTTVYRKGGRKEGRKGRKEQRKGERGRDKRRTIKIEISAPVCGR